MSATTILPGYTVGEDAYNSVSAVCEKHGKTAFLIGGKTAMARALEKLKAALADSALSVTAAEWYGGECSYANIEALAAKVRASGADMVFGMGGGKALDTAKGAAFRCGLPVFTFPTIAATCAAVTALSVVYDDSHAMQEFLFFDDAPPVHAFIDTAVIAAAPQKCLLAGMGDTLAKYYESSFSARGDAPDYASALGLAVAVTCRDVILAHGLGALAHFEDAAHGEDFRQTVLANIVSTGLVSLSVQDCYNCAAAHSLFYALCTLPGFEEGHLHGLVVAYGVLVQLALDGQPAEFALLRRFLKACGVAVTLAENGVCCDRALLAPVLENAVAAYDMQHIPYPVTTEMLWQAILQTENYTE